MFKTAGGGQHPQTIRDRGRLPQIHATILTAMGYDPHGITYVTGDGRPMPLSEGEPIRELVG
jgi:hypothetical protein